MAEDNLILFTDSYKISHYLQYPPGVTKLKAYFESRGGKHPEVIFFGLQYILKRYLAKPITQAMIDEAEQVLGGHFNNRALFNKAGWQYILDRHGGKLPLKIRAAKEGAKIPVKNVLFTVESTDENVPWLVNYFETALVQTWYPMTVATSSYMQKRLIKSHMERTCDDFRGLNFKLHDFGFRGSTSFESAGIGGLAHLVSFEGTDTIAALTAAREYYGPEDVMAGMSIPAVEHSTITSWGKSREAEAAKYMSTEAIKEGPFAIVSDSYDLFNFVENVIGGDLKESIMTRKGGPIVVRPDSGDPKEIVLQVLAKLEAKFGVTLNSKGFKMLPPQIRVIQGDGVCYETIDEVLVGMTQSGWSADNLTFGSGGALLQKVNRDTQKCAFKVCMAVVNGERIDVFKDPVTDPGKASKRGDLTLVKNKRDGTFSTVTLDQFNEAEHEDQLTVVFENGDLKQEWSLLDVRKRVDEQL